MPKKRPLVHRNGRRHIAEVISTEPDGTKTVRYRDGEVEAGVPAADVIEACNSWDLMAPGQWVAHIGSGGVGVSHRDYSIGTRYKKMAERLEQAAAGDPTIKRGMGHSAQLWFQTWEQLDAFARKHLGVTGWTVDLFGAWVPMGDWRATRPGPLVPCQPGRMSVCSKPAKEGESMCGIHAAASARRVANDARMRQQWAERDRRRQEERDANAIAAMWAERIRDEFKINVTPTRDGSRDVAINGEGLYGLLVAVLRDANWVLDDVPVELRLDRHVHGQDSDERGF